MNHTRLENIKSKLRLPLIGVLLVGVVACNTLVLTGCLSSQRYDLSRPINTQDWLLIWDDPAQVNAGALQTPDQRVRVGRPIGTYNAPLWQYINVYPIGTRVNEHAADTPAANTVEGWVNLEAPAMYFLPLYDDSDHLVRSLLVWREGHTSMIAHTFDEDYQRYLNVKNELTTTLFDNGETIIDTRVYWTWIGVFVFAETQQRGFGQFFSDFAVPPTQNLEYNFSDLEGHVLSEDELIAIFEALAPTFADEEEPPSSFFEVLTPNENNEE